MAYAKYEKKDIVRKIEDDYWFILDKNNNPINANYEEVRALNLSKRKQIRKEEIGNISVSTIFLCLAHGYENGKPLLFETMIFGGERDLEFYRTTSYDEIIKTHERIVLEIKKELNV